MKFKQLIDKYSFDDILPELLSIWNKDHIYQLREAMDILRSMSPEEDDGLRIMVYPVNGEFSLYYRVSNMSGYKWQNTLGREICVVSGCELSEKMLLVLCLWERTFYGFSPEQEEISKQDYFQNPHQKKRDEIVQEISELYTGIDIENLNFILEGREYFQGCFIAQVNDGVNYILKSITDYSELSEKDPNSPILLLLRVPEGFRLSSEDKDTLSSVITSLY